MFGGGFQFNGSLGEDRFFNLAKARRNYHNQQHQLQRAQSDAIMRHFTGKPVFDRWQEPGNRAKETPEKVNLPASEQVTLPLTNMERFLEAITPYVPAQYLSKTTMRDWRTCDVEYQPCFLLADFWESFNEWSAYGAGVPLVLHDSEPVVQYYVPYLSAIQIYTEPAKPQPKSSEGVQDIEGECFTRDSSSEGSCESEREKISAYSREKQSPDYQTTDISSKMESLSLRDQQIARHEGLSSDDSEYVNPRGHLLFQYLEHDPPFCREPLYDKISDLALRFPQLKNLRSCDVTSSSWVSVAWYPIYKIPTGPTLRDLEACFLTYHSLYTPMRDVPGVQAPTVIYPDRIGGVPKITLPTFGLSRYKYRGSMWTGSSESSKQLVNSLSQATNNWLRLLQVNHPDHSFFSSRV